ncbi:MAG: ATP-binding protein [Patescibacteria group bacterium]
MKKVVLSGAGDLGRMRQAIRALLLSRHWEEERIGDIVLGLSEIVANCFRHNGDYIVTVAMTVWRGNLFVSVRSDGYSEDRFHSAVLQVYQAADKALELASTNEENHRGVFLAKVLLCWRHWRLAEGSLAFVIPRDARDVHQAEAIPAAISCPLVAGSAA